MKKLLPAILLIASASAYAQMPPPEEIMKANDKNNDGVITKEEAKGSEMEMFFDLMDSNQDGKITMDELKAIPSNPGGPPRGGPGGPPSGGPPAS